jgi:hypothetical protein
LEEVKNSILVHWLLVMMIDTVLLVLDFVHPGGHSSPKEVFGDKATELLTMQ